MPGKSRLGCERTLRLRVDELARLTDNGAEHLRRQHAGIGVVARAVIAIEQGQRRHEMRLAMSEADL